jgi:hypothetical protein
MRGKTSLPKIGLPTAEEEKDAAGNTCPFSRQGDGDRFARPTQTSWAVNRSHYAQIARKSLYYGISDLGKFQSLTLYACHGLLDLTPVSDLTILRRLDLSWNRQLTDLDGLVDLHAVRSLALRGCHKMVDISALSGLANLRSLDLFRCHDLSNIATRSRPATVARTKRRFAKK